MKTVTLTEKTVIKVSAKKYTEMRDKVIDDITLNVNAEYTDPGDMDIVLGVKSLCKFLQESEFNKTTLELVRGLSGFLYWSHLHIGKITRGSALSTIIHDLGEFKKSGTKDWFLPRSHSYSKYI